MIDFKRELSLVIWNKILLFVQRKVETRWGSPGAASSTCDGEETRLGSPGAASSTSDGDETRSGSLEQPEAPPMERRQGEAHLQQPVAPSMERGQDRRVYVATVDALQQ